METVNNKPFIYQPNGRGRQLESSDLSSLSAVTLFKLKEIETKHPKLYGLSTLMPKDTPFYKRLAYAELLTPDIVINSNRAPFYYDRRSGKDGKDLLLLRADLLVANDGLITLSNDLEVPQDQLFLALKNLGYDGLVVPPAVFGQKMKGGLEKTIDEPYSCHTIIFKEEAFYSK